MNELPLWHPSNEPLRNQELKTRAQMEREAREKKESK